MEVDEFRDWFTFHRTVAGAVANHYDRLPESGDRDTVTQARFLALWRRLLGDFDHDELMEASTAMASGGIDPPRMVSDHPRALIRHVMRARNDIPTSQVERRRRYVDGVEVFDCPACRDDGYVRCWTETSMRAARDGTLGQPHTLYAQAVLCQCSEGQRRQSKRNPRPVYDERVDLRVDQGVILDDLTAPDVQQRLVDFVAGLAEREVEARDAKNPPPVATAAAAGEDNVRRLF